MTRLVSGVFLELALEPVGGDGEKMVDPRAGGRGRGRGIGLREISGAFNPRRRKMYLPSFFRASVSDFLASESSKVRIIVHFLHYSLLPRLYVVSVDNAATL